ncbi:inner membrane protein translocase component YidC [Spiroplasma sabaudiense Ar-1343]|uniref:Inner membrane protein translocase component YidC n=1 Tax=Spiroplasma sabaudiense Ar-1343 TaxID=1276257 RepID=W6AKU1_9MOLU|nr:membrane protein insertase YidC [Spiroplasma sabaudiense]AHI54334.1 inner membrane protein translocase component YidC [Spiroplasma sabaudiense Ar-1343]
MYKQDYTKYLTKTKANKKNPWKVAFFWFKIVGFLFLIISMLWGCIQMYQPNFTVGQVTDMTGKSIFAPGVGFEIIIKSLGDVGSKNHFFVPTSEGLSEYGWNPVYSWGSTFAVTKSPFYGFFVYPLAFILVGFIKLFHGSLVDDGSSSFGISVFFSILLTSLIIRGITLLFSWKAQKNQEKMQSMTSKQAEIQAKYKNSTDRAAKQKQGMELAALYKKEGISPLGALAGSFITMPFLFAMFSIIKSTKILKVASIGEISLIEQPFAQIQQGNWVYVSIILVYLPLQIVSMLLPTFLQIFKKNKGPITEQQKKARKKQIIMQSVFVVVFFFIVATVASGVAIYWIFSSTFQIMQTLGFHFARENKNKNFKKKMARKKEKLEKKQAKIALKEKQQA